MARKIEGDCDNRLAGGGVHCCHFYYGMPHLICTVVPLVQAALHRKARCTLSLEAAARHGVAHVLETAGYNLADLQQRGQLELITGPRIAGINSTGILPVEQQLQEMEDRVRELGFTGNLRICQADLSLKTMDWDTFIACEGAVTAALEGRRISVLCLYPFPRSFMGPHYEDIRAVHPQLLNAGRLLDYKGSLVGGTA